MLQLFLTALICLSPAPAAAGSTETVRVPDSGLLRGREGAIFFTDPAVRLRSGDNNSAGPVKKKTVQPRGKQEEKKGTEAPARKKLVPVHFEEKLSGKSPYNCRWALGKFFEIVGGSKTATNPVPQKPLMIRPADKR